MTDTTFFLTAILLIIAIALPIALPIVASTFARIISHEHIIAHHYGSHIDNVIACDGRKADKSHKHCSY
jgi:hypothetical protein